MTPPPISPISSQAPVKPPQESREPRKRPRADVSTAGTSKQKKLKAGQSKLSSFFSKPTPTTTAAQTKAPPDQAGPYSPEIIDLCEDSEEMPVPSPLPTFTSEIRLPADGSSSGAPQSSQSKESEGGGKAGSASWSTLFAPIPPPLCGVHREPAKMFRVNKPGPNKGKTFYLCARPVGPGYDRGRNERLREEVDHRYKCNFFMWASDAKREVMRAGAAGEEGVAGIRAKS
jgi:AP endonuclease-2